MAMLNQDKHQSEDEFSGGSRPMPARYHVAVNQCELGASKEKGTPGINIELQVIAEGLAPDGKTHTRDQTGRTIPGFMAMMSEKGDKETGSCLNQIARFAMATGLLQPGEAKDTDDIAWDNAIGRELIVEIEGRKYTDKGGTERQGSQIAFMGFWSLGNAAVRGVPRDPASPGMLAYAKNGPPQKPQGNTANSQAQIQTQAQTGNANGGASQTRRSRLADL
jgi:hypothetical protein